MRRPQSRASCKAMVLDDDKDDIEEDIGNDEDSLEDSNEYNIDGNDDTEFQCFSGIFQIIMFALLSTVFFLS